MHILYIILLLFIIIINNFSLQDGGRVQACWHCSLNSHYLSVFKTQF